MKVERKDSKIVITYVENKVDKTIVVPYTLTGNMLVHIHMPLETLDDMMKIANAVSNNVFDFNSTKS